MNLTEELIKNIVGNRPKPVSQTGGLENFAYDLQQQLKIVDYDRRLWQVARFLNVIDNLVSWKPDSKSLSNGAPVVAVVLLTLLLEACDFSPPAEAQSGAQPEKPKPTIMVTNPPAPESYKIDIDPSIIDAAGMVLTVEAQTNSEPAPTSTNTPEPSPTVRVPESMTKIVFSTNVYKRLGPGTSYETAGSYKSGDELDFSEIVEKLVNGRYTWLRRSDNTWFALVPGVSYDAESVRHLPDATSIPVAPTTAPTRVNEVKPTREIKTTPATVTNKSGQPVAIYFIDNNGALQISDRRLGINETVEVVSRKNQAIYIKCPGLPGALILTTTAGLTYNEGGTKTTIAAPTPVPPETATTYTGSYWGGTEVNGQTVYRSFDLNNPVGNLLQYDQYGYFCLSPISKLNANYAVEYGGNPINFPHVGKVINKLVNPDGSITVTLENNYVFQINSSTLWYVQLQTLSGPATGATACVHSNELMGAFNGINVGNIVGHDGAHAVLVGIP